ncbi:MAG: chemotaxis protein CheW [Granulosicoccus sp.]
MQDSNNTSTDIAETADQFLSFLIAGEEYGIEILKVQEIKSWGPYTPLPKSPDYVLGVINLRGAIVPIIDLRSRFGLPPTDYTATTAVIIVRTGSDDHARIIGLVVDSVSEVYHLSPDAIQDASEGSSSEKESYVRGFGQIGDKLVILVNLDPIIMESLGQIQKMADAA